MAKLQRIVKRAIRNTGNGNFFNTTISRDVNFKTLNEIIAILAIKLYEKLNFLDNEVIDSIPDSNPASNRNTRKP